MNNFMAKENHRFETQPNRTKPNNDRKKQHSNRYYYMGFCLFILLEMRRYNDYLKQFLLCLCVHCSIAYLSLQCTLQCDLINYNITMSMYSHSISSSKNASKCFFFYTLYFTLLFSLNVGKLLGKKKRENKMEIKSKSCNIRLCNELKWRIEKKT